MQTQSSEVGAGAGKKKPSPALGALGTLYERRWLLWYFVQRQISQDYKSSFLGFAWAFLTPLLLIGLYTLIFSEVVGLRFRDDDSVANFGIYLYCGLVPFLTYADSLNKAVGTIRSNSSLVQRVVFPLEILPLSNALTAFISQFFGLGVLMVVASIWEGEVQWTVALLPLIMIPQLLFIVGLGYLFATIGAYLPDVQEALRAIVRASFFATPVIWPAERAYDAGLGFIVDYNPLAILVQGYRNLLLDGEIPDVVPTLGFLAFSTVLCVVGFILFNRLKQNFADLI